MSLEKDTAPELKVILNSLTKIVPDFVIAAGTFFVLVAVQANGLYEGIFTNLNERDEFAKDCFCDVKDRIAYTVILSVLVLAWIIYLLLVYGKQLREHLNR